MHLMSRRLVASAAAIVLGSTALVAASSASATTSRTYTPTYTTLTMAHPYTPTAPAGSTDDYHCTVINPNLKADSYITSSNFSPGPTNAVEVHHAILFLVPPALVATALAANQGGKGWTCFGETIFSKQSIPIPGVKNSVDMPEWLSGWAPGHGVDNAPKGTGVFFPKGSLVVLQIHYNMLAGSGSVQSSLTLGTVPAAAKLKALSLDFFLAPPDVPCPASWNPATIALCQRSNSMKYLGARFGQSAIDFVNLVEAVCGRNPSNPPASDTTTCTWRYHRTAKIVEIAAHMHLTGSAFKVVLNPGSRTQKVLLNVKNFNFDFQRPYALKAPVAVRPGDRLQVTCTYNPKVHDFNPELKKALKRFVTWGDGSSDEMCLAMVSTIS